MALGGIILLFPPTRWISKKFLPKPGQGPSEEIQTKGFFTMKFWGKGKSQDGKVKYMLGGLNAMTGDPGYAQTARFVAEAGVACLSKEKFPSSFSGGVLTPSTVRFFFFLLPWYTIKHTLTCLFIFFSY